MTKSEFQINDEIPNVKISQTAKGPDRRRFSLHERVRPYPDERLNIAIRRLTVIGIEKHA